MKFRKKPVVIEAIQFTGDNQAAVADFMGISPVFGDAPGGGLAVHLTTVHGDTAYARPGDWIIPESTPGQFYPCNPGVFAATYEAVE